MSNTEGFLLYASMFHTIEDMAEEDIELAFEYFMALAKYSFYGEEYSGKRKEIKFLMNSEMEHIDRQRVRYAKAVKGGSSVKVTDEQILEAFENNNFSSISEAARFIAAKYTADGKFSRQALTKRLQTLGISFDELSSQNFSNPKTQLTCASASNPQVQPQVQVNNPTPTSTPTPTLTDNIYSLAQSATVVNKTEEEINKIKKEYNIIINGWGYSKEQAADYICKQYSISLDEIEYILGDNAAVNKKTKAEKKNPLDGLL